MAHKLENSKSMFSVRTTPWHGLGVVLPEAPTISEAIVAAGLDFEVECQPLFMADGTKVKNRAVVRVEDNKVLGVVGEKFTPVQNRHKFDWFQPFIERNEAHLTTAGSLHGGSRTWVMAELNRAPMEVVKGDEVRKFLLLSDSFDGSLSVRIGFTPQRVVCWNTLRAAHNNAESQLIRLRHSKNVHENMAIVRDTVDIWDQQFEATAAQYRLLARKSINQRDVQEYVKRVLKVDKEDAGDISTRTKNKMDQIFKLIESGRGQDNPAVRGTLWAAYNGMTEYLAYEYGHNPDTRLNALWYGEGARLNQRALETAMVLAA